MVPSGWTLKDLQTIILGNIKNGFSPVASDSKTGYWVLGLGALSDDGIKIDEIKPVKPTKKVIDSVLSKGDFLVSRSNTPDKVGRSIKYRGEIDNCSYPDLMMKFRVDFVEHQLKSSVVRTYFKMCASGSSKSMVKINKKVLEKTPLLIPPLIEQQKIAKILTTWDKAVRTTERLIENSRQQKKALMQQLLTGKKRLLDDDGRRFAGEWEEYKLGEITDFIRDGTHGTHKRYENGVPMLSAKNITKQNTVDFDDAPYISEEDYNQIHAKYTIKSGDILLTVVGTLGRVALVPEKLAKKFTLQRSVAIIRVAKGIFNQFLMQLFSSNDFTHLLHRKSNSTAQAGVYLGELGKLKILLPSFKEQQKIAAVLTNADKEIELLEQQLADLQQEKKALMQQLLTGKRRVVDEEFGIR